MVELTWRFPKGDGTNHASLIYTHSETRWTSHHLPSGLTIFFVQQHAALIPHRWQGPALRCASFSAIRPAKDRCMRSVRAAVRLQAISIHISPSPQSSLVPVRSGRSKAASANSSNSSSLGERFVAQDTRAGKEVACLGFEIDHRAKFGI
jgi:hypothetical protein